MTRSILLTAALAATISFGDAHAQSEPILGPCYETREHEDVYRGDSTSGASMPEKTAAHRCVEPDGSEDRSSGWAEARRGGTYVDRDTAHYPRGSILNVILFIDHDGGTWTCDERNAMAEKASDAKQFYLNHMPPEGFLTWDNEGSSSYWYYRATLPYDVSEMASLHSFDEYMVEDAIELLGFSDEDGDGGVIDDMTLWLQNWGGGWDNVILTATPADYNFRARASLTRAYIRVDQYDEAGVWAHEWGHVLGACDEYVDFWDEGQRDSCQSGVDCGPCPASPYITVNPEDYPDNANCVLCGTDPCIMKSSRGSYDGPPCSATHGQWAWVDADGNGRLDKTIAWDPLAEDVYEIYELPHNTTWTHSRTDWGLVANQKWTSWSAIGVRTRSTANWNLWVYGDNNRNYLQGWSVYPDPNDVDFVVGDFNHDNLGQDHVRVYKTSGSGQYVLHHEAGNQMLFADGVVRSKTWQSLQVVRAFDVPLFAGETIRFELDVQSAGLDLGMALFKSNGGTYYGSRATAEIEVDGFGAGADEFFEYTVTDDDVYGLILWSNAETGGDFTIQVGPTTYALAEEARYTTFAELQLFSFAPYTNYWAVSAVRPGASSNVRLRQYEESTFETLLQTSGAYPNVEFVASDYNPGFSTDYLRVLRQSGGTAHTTQWEQGADILAGWQADNWGSGFVCKVWDTHLLAGQKYRVQQYDELFNPISAGIYLVSSADGDRYKARSGAEVGSNERTVFAEWFTYTPSVDDWYGLVMIANDNSDGAYTIGVGPSEVLTEQSPVVFPDEIVWGDIDSEAGSWTVAGVRPEAGSISSMWIWDCKDRILPCFRDGDSSGDLVRYVAIDANHEAAATYYTRADRNAGVGEQAVSFDVAEATDISFDDLDEAEHASGSFVEDEVVQVWDLDVTIAPVTVQVVVVPRSPDLDLAVSVHDSGDGDLIQGSADAIAVVNDLGAGGQEVLLFDAAVSDVFGLVVTNRSGAAGDYDIHVYDPGLLDVGEDAAPRELAFQAVGVASERPTFRLALPESSPVRVDVFDVNGRRVRTLADEELPSGVHLLAWDGRSAGGAPVASGIYFARLRTSSDERVVKLVRRR